MTSEPTYIRHRFLDEAGDTTFYGEGKTPVIGIKDGVSLCFILGMVKLRAPLNPIREEIRRLQNAVANNSYYKDIPSIQKKKLSAGGFYFHTTDDTAEVRKEFYEFIKTLELSFEAVVGRKLPALYARKHNNRESEFYADLLSHLLKNKFQAGGDLILNISQRGNVTRNETLQHALAKASSRFLKKKLPDQMKTRIVFNVQTPRAEPLLNVADYLCWAVQRVFERGEMRYFNFVQEKIALVVDLYDSANYEGNRNYYTERNKLGENNKLSPPSY